MFLNETLLVLTYTANIMARLPKQGNPTSLEDTNDLSNLTTTTLSPEEAENKFEFEDQWYMWRCYEPYGCFYIGAPWSGENRPVSTFPARPDSINPRYLLYTRAQSGQAHEMKIDHFETIENAPLRRDKNLYFVIHGFLDNGDNSWVLRTMKELLLREDCNVVVVNWIGGAGPPYTQAVANTRLVGAMTARLAAQIINVGNFLPTKMTAIGHSLGAHTSGYVGYTLRTRYNHVLGRIIGLDPAEPHFSNTSPMVRLDPTDAAFVTAIHTDCNPFISGGLGITQPVGHIDFYPNGGRNQPGCNEGVLNSITLERGSFFRGIKRFLGCNHIRSYEYFIESINTHCPFLAVPCQSWDKFQEGACFDCVNQYCPRFGLDAQPGNYHASVYLMTGSNKPFCKAHYRVTINISNTNESLNYGGEVGMFVIRVIGANSKQTEKMKLSTTSKYYEPGSVHKIVLPGDVVGKPESVEITWEYQTSVFNPLTWRLLHTPRAYIDSMTIENLEFNHGITVCPDETKTLLANEPKILTTENCVNTNTNVVSTIRRSDTSKRNVFEAAGAVLWLLVALTPAICSAGILDPFQWARSDRIEVNIPWLPFENETRCYNELGCLNITRSWYHLMHRPLNVFPLPREVINTSFILYTNDNPTVGQVLTVAKDKTIKYSNFNPKKKTKFIIHGFIDTPLSSWVKEMRHELLKHGDYNVIVVDWAGGSLPLYTQATANTRLVGLEIAHLIRHLQNNYGLDPNDVHLIGHSLGAHTAGYAGEKLRGNVGRITGLDPAEPYFQGMPSHLRLDYTDAQLVDVIHTDGKSIFFLGYGMSQPCGHLDFYPNNGKEQPGCTDLSETTPSLPLTLIREGFDEASRVLVACNHVRAIKLFTESINSKCQYVAHECSSYASFLKGECFSCKGNDSLNCAVMGYHADTSPALQRRRAAKQEASSLLGSKFFFNTGKEDPYCRRHYRITVNLARPPTAESWVQGFMKVTLHADNGLIRNMDLTPSGYMRLEHGSSVQMVVAHPAGSIGKIRRVELSWSYDMDVLQPRSLCFFWCNDRLYVNSVSVDVMELPGRGKRETDLSSKLCSANRQQYAEIASGSTASFIDSC